MTEETRTEVAIVGAGPAGLLLGRMLQQIGIDAVVLERRSRDYVLQRVRAGVLEPGTVATLRDVGAADRLEREGLPHERMQIRFDGERRLVPLVGEDGRRLTTYGQAKVVRDLIDLREADGLPLVFEAEVEALEGLENAPKVHYTAGGQRHVLHADVVAGCDGYWGPCRRHIPGFEEHSLLREYPFAWLGVLAEAVPNPEVRGFAHSTRGMAVASARSSSIGRLYLQVPPEQQPDAMSDEEIWDELDRRLDTGDGSRLNRGPIVERSVARLRGFVCTKMAHGRLCLAGDAAHIVPPTGAKGLNLAVGDVRVLAETVRQLLRDGRSDMLAQYSEICLRRILPTVHWSCELSDAFHLFPGQSAFDTEMQYQALGYWTGTEPGQTRLRNAMLGQPFEV